MHLALYANSNLTALRMGHKSKPKTLMGTYATKMKSSEAVRFFGIVPRSVEPEVLKERQGKRELMMHEKKLIAARNQHRIHNKFMAKKLEKWKRINEFKL